MAKLTQGVQPKLFTIDNFYGLNMAKVGDTQLVNGESGDLENCYVTKDYNISKAPGYLQLMTSVAAKNIQGMWFGSVGGTEYFLFAINGHIYKMNDLLWEDFDGTDVWSTVTTDLGTLTDAPTQFFGFDDKVYMLNGTEYKYWDGSTFGDVAGYVPKIYIATVPSSGAGVEYESLNLLTGSKRLTYDGDGTATYTLPETAIDSVDYVYVDGVLKTVTTHYTVNLTTGVVTFTAGNYPSTGLDNVEIYYTKGSGTRSTVVKNRFPFLFGTASDTRVFMYGNPTSQNVRINSSLADGVPSAEYFTSTNIDQIGSSAYPITSMERQQSIMLIHKTNETYYSYYDSVDLDGITTVTFPAPIINDSRGNLPMGQGQVLNNDPFTIDNQFIKWSPTETKDERNMSNMGERIQKDLDLVNLEDMLTVDKQNSSEMWMSNGKKVWIYKYDLKYYRKLGSGSYKTVYGTFSRLLLEDEPTCWMYLDGYLYFGTTNGEIMKIDESYLTFNGTAIDSYWEMNMYDFGGAYLYKTLNKSWITLAAQPNVRVSLQYITDKNAYSTPYEVTYNLITFDDVDFADFSFYTNYNPQTFYLRLKAKKFKYLKLRIDNNSATETFSLLSLTLQTEYGSEVK